MQPTVCLIPKLAGIGGMVSFQAKLVQGFSRRGINVCYRLNDTTPDSILVIGGTRNLHQLWQAKKRGIKIVQRLDGMNWIHRVLNTGINHWLRAEYGNAILRFIRSYLADTIAYQSQFSKGWWERERGKTTCQNVIIHNGVDLTKFVPGVNGKLQKDNIRLLLVEGSLLGGYEFGLENAIYLANELVKIKNSSKRVELMVVGKTSNALQKSWEKWVENNVSQSELLIKWIGVVDHLKIDEVYRQADLLFSADINAACPNSVIESLASGTPVVAFDTGALPELLDGKGGIVVPYGGDPWKVDSPDIKTLAEEANYILDNLDDYRKSARRHAETAFDLEVMVDQYVELLLG
jgi:glycosyltransferase involved in cell wall biosynthesis